MTQHQDQPDSREAAYTDLRETLEAVEIACGLMQLAGGSVARIGVALGSDVNAALKRADALLSTTPTDLGEGNV